MTTHLTLEQLAERFDAGLLDPAPLLDEVAALRRAFDEHNQFEERVLGRVLRDAKWLGAVRVSKMVEGHIEEHRAIRRELASRPTSGLRTVLSSLREHLETEELLPRPEGAARRSRRLSPAPRANAAPPAARAAAGSRKRRLRTGSCGLRGARALQPRWAKP